MNRAVAADAVPLDDVVAALLGLESDDLPYSASVEEWKHGAQVTLTWTGWEDRWRSLLGAGQTARSYRLVVRLDARRAVYRFTEISGRSRRSVAASPAGVHAETRWDGHRGKTFGARSGSVVVAQRVTSSGDRTYEVTHVAAVSASPSTIKVPVFSTLRALGWRPRVDNRFVRLFER
ncbi:hypothetical protein ACFVQ3_09565 [Oerskovia sp. NPDC057915]|uniref:hypothetical protein n=1 Tax=Oerskovia sp. NPDC057915 TaxID=3346280 RepID=UPI0036DD4990